MVRSPYRHRPLVGRFERFLNWLAGPETASRRDRCRLHVELLETRDLPSATLLKDFIPGAPDGSSPSNLISVGSTLFFTANDGFHGPELWKSDGTAAGTALVKDIQTGISTPSLFLLTNVNGTLFFSAFDGTNARNLWKSDGTSAGTVPVQDIASANGNSNPRYLANVNGTLFFSAFDGNNGYELWKSNGTSAGTVPVKDICAGFSNSSPALLTNVSGTIFFTATDGINGTELWKSDGTATGTSCVQDIVSGSGSSSPTYLTNVNGTLFFRANDGTDGIELWKSDGTAAGTVLVKDIRTGSSSSMPFFSPKFVNVNGTLFFRADDGINGYELWKSDGTATGTARVKDIRTGSSGSNPSDLTNVNGTLFFQATDGINGTELWKSDGTAIGTALVKDIRTGSGSSGPRYLKNVSGTLFFQANDGTNGTELWQCDGTATGTVLVQDIRPGSGSSSPASLTNGNGTLFFQANDGSNGYELWKCDGTASGTALIKDIRPGGSRANFLTVNRTLFFSATDETNGTELWTSDGTSAGTALFKDINPGSGNSSPGGFTYINGTLFFFASDGTSGYELWKSDGTSTGTVLVKDIRTGSGDSSPVYLTNVSGTLYFSATDGTSGRELWKSDGTATGTVRVQDINPGSGDSGPRYLMNVNGTLFFRGNGATGGGELWKSTGTSTGTVLVKDILTGSSGSLPRYLTNVNGMLFFRANDGTNGYELWKSDGTATGTTRVQDIYPGFGSSGPQYLTNVNGTLFFRATDGTSGSELWKSDGTATGTSQVKDITPGSDSSIAALLTNVNGTLFFSAFDDTHGVELWKSDGTSAGTALVKDIRTGGGNSSFHYMANVNGTLFFSAFDGTHGSELWKSDGSSAGTALVQDIVPGIYDSDPGSFAVAGTHLFFLANDLTAGREWWTLELLTDPVDTDAAANSVAENAASGTAVGITASATDLYGATVTYSLADDAGGRFQIGGSTGAVTVADGSLIDYESSGAGHSYAITVRATQGSLSSTASFTIKVSNQSPVAPTDADASANSVAENAANGTAVGITASAPDPAGGAVTYALTDDAGGRFQINSSTGVVTVANGALLDYETATNHQITVRASDPAGLFQETSFTISVINQPPSAPADAAAAANSVLENAFNGTTVGITVSSTDPAGGTVTYSLTDDAGGRFAIDSATGVVTVVNGALLDFETATSHQITVRASDPSGQYQETTFTIQVTDQPPTIPADNNAVADSVLEGAANGTLVGITASSTDPDGGTVSYALSDNAGGRFAINSSTGMVTVANGCLIDYESSGAAHSYTIAVQATHGTVSSTASFSITVTNEPPAAPVDANAAADSVVENAANGTSVGITASSADPAGGTVTYSLIDDAGGRFQINSSTGVVTVANGALLDFESATSNSITVRASDSSGLFQDASFTVTVTNAAPSAPVDSNATTNGVAENAATGTVVGITASATDPAGGTVIYSLSDSAGGRFQIDSSTGVVTVANGSLLDYETATSHQITVRASDPSGLFQDSFFTVTVTNVAPSASTDSNAAANSVAENATIGTAVGITAASTDPAGGTVIYSLFSDAGGRYTIDSTTGVITVAGQLSFAGSGGSDTITVRASDGALFSSTTNFTITVTPIVTLQPDSLTVGMAATGYRKVVTASGGTLTGYTFTVTAGALPAGLFLSSAGVLHGTPTTAGTYDFTITAQDSGGHPGSQAYSLTIQPAIALSPATLANGTAGMTYTQNLSATGGNGSYTFAITAGALPGGLDLDEDSGTLSGTPTIAGTFTFTVTATDDLGRMGNQSYTVTIAPALTLSPTLATGVVGSAYSQALSATGGSGTGFTFAVSAGALPGGLSLSGAGPLSGTPTVAGTFSFTVTAADSQGLTGYQAYTLSINQTLALNPAALTVGTTGVAYSQTFTATGGSGTGYTFTRTAGTLPKGLALSSAGLLHGKPTAAGSFSFTVRARDSQGHGTSRAYTVLVGGRNQAIVVGPTSLAAGAVGTAYSQAIRAGGGTGTGFSFTRIAGTLPAGLALSSAGLLHGTPTAAGSFSFTVRARDSLGRTGSRSYTLTVKPALALSPTTLPAATAGTAYSTTVSATGGNGSYSFALTAGALPGGLSLSGAGLLSGIPTVGGTFGFTVRATDSLGRTGSRAYSLTVAPALTLGALDPGTVDSAYSQAVGVTGSSGPYKFAVTAGALPGGLSLDPDTGLLSGTPTVADTFSFTVTATDSGGWTGSRVYTLTVAPALMLSPAALSAGAVGVGYGQALSASGGSGYVFTVLAGALPDGLDLSPEGGLLGIPLTVGTFDFTVLVKDSTGLTGSRVYRLTIGT